MQIKINEILCLTQQIGKNSKFSQHSLLGTCGEKEHSQILLVRVKNRKSPTEEMFMESIKVTYTFYFLSGKSHFQESDQHEKKKLFIEALFLTAKVSMKINTEASIKCSLKVKRGSCHPCTS